jgi:hypothetical protein
VAVHNSHYVTISHPLVFADFGNPHAVAQTHFGIVVSDPMGQKVAGVVGERGSESVLPT